MLKEGGTQYHKKKHPVELLVRYSKIQYRAAGSVEGVRRAINGLPLFLFLSLFAEGSFNMFV